MMSDDTVRQQGDGSEAMGQEAIGDGVTMGDQERCPGDDVTMVWVRGDGSGVRDDDGCRSRAAAEAPDSGKSAWWRTPYC